MTPEFDRAAVLCLQWGLLIGYAVVTLAALVDGRHMAARRMAVAVLFIALPHAVYYALFLVWPEVLGPMGTMMFSIALRYQPLFVAALMLALARRGKWKL